MRVIPLSIFALSATPIFALPTIGVARRDNPDSVPCPDTHALIFPSGALCLQHNGNFYGPNVNALTNCRTKATMASVKSAGKCYFGVPDPPKPASSQNQQPDKKKKSWFGWFRGKPKGHSSNPGTMATVAGVCAGACLLGRSQSEESGKAK